MMRKLTDEESKTIARFVEEGLAHCEGKLAGLAGKPWTASASGFRELDHDELLAELKQDPEPHYAAHLRSQSLLPLEILTLFPEKGLHAAADAATQADAERFREAPNRMRAVLGEFANILGQGILRAVVNALKISAILTVPKLMQGKKAELAAQALPAAHAKAFALILARVDLASAEVRVPCSVLLIVDVSVVRGLLKNAKT